MSNGQKPNFGLFWLKDLHYYMNMKTDLYVFFDNLTIVLIPVHFHLVFEWKNISMNKSVRL